MEKLITKKDYEFIIKLEKLFNDIIEWVEIEFVSGCYYIEIILADKIDDIRSCEINKNDHLYNWCKKVCNGNTSKSIYRDYLIYGYEE